MDRIEARILEIIDQNADRLKALAEDLFEHAEQGYHEYRTAKVAADFLKELGLETTEGLAITGLKAPIKAGDGPNVALIGELDAVGCPSHPQACNGFAHACGHNDQMVSILGAALALNDPEVKAALNGTATIFAVPAEEYLDASVRAEVKESHGVLCSGGKCELIRRGEFEGIDMAITNHSLMAGRGESDLDLMLGNSACSGFVGKTVYMHGKAAHAAAAPHAGVNALNAASLGMAAVGMIRETFQEKDYIRVHPYIRKGGDAINIVPSEVIVDMMVRAANMNAINEASAKVDNAFKGGALAIGAECEIVNAQGYMPVFETAPQPILWEAAQPLADRGMKVGSIPLGVQNAASTDVGDLAAMMPVLNFTFGGSVGALHSQDYKITDEYVAHVMPAQMMALLTYHLLKDGAAGAKQILAESPAKMTLEEYRAYVESLQN